MNDANVSISEARESDYFNSEIWGVDIEDLHEEYGLNSKRIKRTNSPIKILVEMYISDGEIKIFYIYVVEKETGNKLAHSDHDVTGPHRVNGNIKGAHIDVNSKKSHWDEDTLKCKPPTMVSDRGDILRRLVDTIEQVIYPDIIDHYYGRTRIRQSINI